VTVRFGPALDLRASGPGPDVTTSATSDGVERLGRRAGLDASTEAMMRAIAAMLPASYRGRFG
jgi:hypothetical protein